ncbi:MAG: twin-arginine translocation signal domain-containing protein [Lacunisphaera sp.]
MSNHGDHSHHPCLGVSTDIEDYFLTRRQFLGRVGMGLGALGLATMIDPRLFADTPSAGPVTATGSLAPRLPPFPGKAKAVIHIFAQGARRTSTRGIRSRSWPAWTTARSATTAAWPWGRRSSSSATANPASR